MLKRVVQFSYISSHPDVMSQTSKAPPPQNVRPQIVPPTNTNSMHQLTHDTNRVGGMSGEFVRCIVLRFDARSYYVRPCTNQNV